MSRAPGAVPMAIVIPGAVLQYFLLLVLLPIPLKAVIAVGVTAVLLALVLSCRSKADRKYKSLVYRLSRRTEVDEDEARRRARRAHLDWEADYP